MLMEADLPGDVGALHGLALEQSRKRANVIVATSEADAEIEWFKSIVDAFTRHRSGRKSEQLDPDQFQPGAASMSRWKALF